MAAPGRRTDSSVEDLLFERGYEFDFFQAVCVLSRIYTKRAAPGGNAAPGAEVVRFGAHLSMDFPASVIHDVWRPPRIALAPAGRPVNMTVAFMGLTGPQGILPSHYTELLIAEDYADRSALAGFLDCFNHRLISLFYRAWEKHHFLVGYERANRHTDDRKEIDRFTQYLFDLIGMGTPNLRGRLLVPDQALLRYAGLIAQRPHSAAALAGILRDYFDLPVEIDQFQGKWFALEEPSRSYMDHEGVHNQLGFGAIVGDAVWNQQARFRIRIGPIGVERFVDFLPEGKAFAEMLAVTRYFVDQALEFDIQLILAAAEVPWCRLSDEGFDNGKTPAPRLGWLGWLKAEEFSYDASDAVFAGVN